MIDRGVSDRAIVGHGSLVLIGADNGTHGISTVWLEPFDIVTNGDATPHRLVVRLDGYCLLCTGQDRKREDAIMVAYRSRRIGLAGHKFGCHGAIPIATVVSVTSS